MDYFIASGEVNLMRYSTFQLEYQVALIALGYSVIHCFIYKLHHFTEEIKQRLLKNLTIAGLLSDGQEFTN